MIINENGKQVDFKLDLNELEGKNAKEKLELLKSNFKSIEDYFNKSFKELEEQLAVERELEQKKEEEIERQKNEKIRKEIGIDHLTKEEIASKDLGVMPLSSWCLITGTAVRGGSPIGMAEELEKKYNYKFVDSFGSIDFWDCPMNQEEFVKFAGGRRMWNRSDVNLKNWQAILGGVDLHYGNRKLIDLEHGLTSFDYLSFEFPSAFNELKNSLKLYCLHSSLHAKDVSLMISNTLKEIENSYKKFMVNCSCDSYKELFDNVKFLGFIFRLLLGKRTFFKDFDMAEINNFREYAFEKYKDKVQNEFVEFWNKLNLSDRERAK